MCFENKVGKKILCSEEDCDICFEMSFASSNRSKFWSTKNELTPRQVYKNSHRKFIFVCENNHEFNSTLQHVSSGTWCPRCSTYNNETECIQIIEKLTGKPFKTVKPKFLQISPKATLELDGYNDDLKLALEYNGRQHYEYNVFFHRNDIANFTKQQEHDIVKRSCVLQIMFI